MRGFEFLKHHPYFVEEKKGNFYFDDGEKYLYVLEMHDLKDTPVNPINYKLFFRNHRPSHLFLTQAPSWFRLLFFQATEVFFETQRIKTIFYKRSIVNILLTLIAFFPSNEECTHFFYHQWKQDQFIIFKHQTRAFELATDLLKKNNYIVDIVEEENTWIINYEKENEQ